MTLDQVLVMLAVDAAQREIHTMEETAKVAREKRREAEAAAKKRMSDLDRDDYDRQMSSGIPMF